MAIHRKVRQHSQTYLWAYVEWSDEKQDVFTLLGGQQFLKKEEAEDYSKGFAEGSYEWIEPTELKIKRLRLEKEKLEKRVNEIYYELTAIFFPEYTEVDKKEIQAKQDGK
jgi:hypothetical protein